MFLYNYSSIGIYGIVYETSMNNDMPDGTYHYSYTYVT